VEHYVRVKRARWPKPSTHIAATKKDERRIFIDISTVKKAKKGEDLARPNWYLMVDERTQLKFSKFYPKQNDMIEPACAQLQKWKQAGLGVTHIRLNNAGENTKLQERAESAAWKLGMQFEYTARDMPQQNHLAELGFTILGNKGRACMVTANVPMTIQYKLCPKAFKYATGTDGLQVMTINGLTLTRYKYFCGKNPKFAQHLRTWGEAGTVKKRRKKTTPKIADQGVQCMFIGYAKDHEGDCYQIIWLRRMFYAAPEAVPEIALEPDEDINIVTPGHKNKANNPNKPSGESVDDDDSINIGDADDEGKMPKLIPQTNEDSDSEDEDDEDSDAENNKGPVTGRTSSGRAVRAPIRYRDREIGAMLADIERMDIEDAYVQAEIASAAVNAREWEPVLSPAEAKYLKAMEEIDGTDFGISDEDANEYAAVGAGLGGGFTNTAELRPI
jgi:hypothetical protein